MSADLGKYRYFSMRINPSLTTADGGSSFILTSVPSSRQILWLLVTVAMQQQQRKVWGVLVTTWNELAMCVWGWEVWGVRWGGGTTILQTGWGEGTEHIQLSLKKRRQKEGEEEEEKLRLVTDKRKKRGGRKAQAGQTWLWHFPNPLWHTPDVWQPGTDGEGGKKAKVM